LCLFFNRTLLRHHFIQTYKHPHGKFLEISDLAWNSRCSGFLHSLEKYGKILPFSSLEK